MAGAPLIGIGNTEVLNGAAATPPNNQPVSGGGGGGYRGGGGGGGGGGSTGPSDEQKKAGDNLAGITGYNKDTVIGNYEDTMSVLDISDQQNKFLHDTQVTQAKRKAGDEWFSQHKKLQDTVSQTKDAAGGAMRGSFLYDYSDLLADQDDTIDEATLRNMRENINSIDNSYFEALAQNNNSRNEAAMNAEQGFRELAADYIAQLNNIHPDLAKDMIDGGNHTLKPPSWLNTDFFDSHKKEPVKPDDFSFIRPDMANKKADELNTGGSNISQSVSGDYWQRMTSGYDQRKRQA